MDNLLIGGKYIQLDFFDMLSSQPKTEREEDILFAVNHGSGFEHGKIRILNFYNSQEVPNLQTFADYLREEYGTGGCGLGIKYREEHRPTGIHFSRYGRDYSFNWLQYAKEIAKVIDNNEYDCSGQMKSEFYKKDGDTFWTQKTYYFVEHYNGKKVISAYLSSVYEEPNNYVYKDYSYIMQNLAINIDEIGRAITSGTYDNTEEIWEDIKKSGRFINGAVFGGRKHLDEDGIKKALNNFKKSGTCWGIKLIFYKPRGWEFWQSRAYDKGIIDYDGNFLKGKNEI